MVRLTSSIRQLCTLTLDPFLLSTLFINHFFNKLICYTQCHVFGLFLVIHSAPSSALAVIPAFWFRCPSWPGRRGPLRSVGPWWGGMKSRELGGHPKGTAARGITLPLHLSFPYALCVFPVHPAATPTKDRWRKTSGLHRGDLSAKNTHDTPLMLVI